MPRKGQRIRVSNRHGPARVLDRIERGLFPDMRQVDEHPEAIHLIHNRPAEASQAAVDNLVATAADEVLDVVGELRDSDPQSVKDLHQSDVVLKWRRILKSEKDRRATRALSTLEVRA